MPINNTLSQYTQICTQASFKLPSENAIKGAQTKGTNRRTHKHTYTPTHIHTYNAIKGAQTHEGVTNRESERERESVCERERV